MENNMDSLKMIFSRERTVGDVENDFHRAFPHLKIELFNHGHAEHEGSPIRDRLHPHQPLADLIENEAPIYFPLDSEMKVSDFEKGIWDQFKIGAQVFRHLGDTYVMTTRTDDWTLGLQEAEGEKSFESFDHLHEGE